MPPDKRDEIATILMDNMSKEFVQRIVHNETSPTIPWGENQTASHQMAANEIGGDKPGEGRFLAYPEVVNTPEGMKSLKGMEAIIYALENNEYIEFPTQEEATEFSKNYKKFWK